MNGAEDMQDIERATRERAYQLWVQSGHQHGNAESHWLTAQREILSTSLSELGVVKVDRSSQKQKTSRKQGRAA